MRNKAMFTSYRQDWKTPSDLKKQLYDEFNFDYEPCSGNAIDDLTTDWGKRNYLNPPYKTKIQDAFIRKSFEESCQGKLVVCLVPVRTSAKRWQQYIFPHAKEIRFLPHRLCFDDGDNRSIFDSAIVIFDGRTEQPLQRFEPQDINKEHIFYKCPCGGTSTVRYEKGMPIIRSVHQRDCAAKNAALYENQKI